MALMRDNSTLWMIGVKTRRMGWGVGVSVMHTHWSCHANSLARWWISEVAVVEWRESEERTREDEDELLAERERERAESEGVASDEGRKWTDFSAGLVFIEL